MLKLLQILCPRPLLLQRVVEGEEVIVFGRLFRMEARLSGIGVGVADTTGSEGVIQAPRHVKVGMTAICVGEGLISAVGMI